MKYRHIVFDVDGTLIDTREAVLNSLKDTIEYVKRSPVRTEELTFALGITGRDTLALLDVPDIPFALNLWLENMKKYKDSIRVFNLIPHLLKRLKSSGCQLGIVTSKTRAEFAADFSVFGIDGYFEYIVCADDTQKHKPHPEPLLKYMALAGCTGEETLYIGDSPYDIECAQKAGTHFALAGWGAAEGLNAPVIFGTPLDAAEALLD